MSAGSTHRRRGRRRAWLVVLLVALLAAASAGVGATPATAAPAKVNGQGSTYVALAMQQWVADAQTNGLQVNYLPTGSPQGLQSFGQSLVDFAGTEAEFSALASPGIGDSRGFQYVPSVAGAVAIMYNVQDKAGRKVDYLHLSRRTVARIFTGDISRWSDPAISEDNKGLQLPDQPINVVYRGGQSGTTGLFYDFVQNVAPDVFNPWAARNQLPTSVRIIQLDSAPQFAPKTQAFQGSDQIAQFLASSSGLWSIGYDEFGYAKTYRATSAWIQNASGNWVLPYAQNISSALEDARLRPDLSQELSGVYNSGRTDAYPISAYSYIVTQCAPTGDRPSCRGPYSNPGVGETLAKWLRYIACDGQVNMARIGYSPLPPNLSQEVANSVGRMTGSAPEQLSAGNCNNPRFKGNLGAGAASPSDPLAKVASLGGAGGSGGGAASGGAASSGSGAGASSAAGAGSTGAGGSSAAASSAADAATTDGAAATDEASGGAGRGGVSAAGGGSTDWRRAAPVAYSRPGIPSSAVLPIVVVAALLLPPLLLGGALRRRRQMAVGSGTAPSPPSGGPPPPG